eukprot:scaffold3141_cov350-Prasinococcus_capsulatus_cf.AAC.5
MQTAAGGGARGGGGPARGGGGPAPARRRGAARGRAARPGVGAALPRALPARRAPCGTQPTATPPWPGEKTDGWRDARHATALGTESQSSRCCCAGVLGGAEPQRPAAPAAGGRVRRLAAAQPRRAAATAPLGQACTPAARRGVEHATSLHGLACATATRQGTWRHRHPHGPGVERGACANRAAGVGCTGQDAPRGGGGA